MAAPGSQQAESGVAVSPEAFTTEPCAARASELHRSYRARMRHHFLGALASAAEGLAVDLSPLVARVEAITPDARLSPAAYVQLSQLSDALQSGDVTRVTDRLQALSNLPERELRDARLRIGPVLTEGWETDFIPTVRGDPAAGRARDARLVRALIGHDASPAVRACAEALDLLSELDPELFGEFQEYITRVKIFAGRGYLGFSSPAAFGALFIRLPEGDPVEHFLEHLVHELSHSSLNVLMAHDPLLRNPQGESRAPLRSDLRPLYQVFHATFVLNRNVRVMRRARERYPDLGYEVGLADFEAKYREGHREVEARAEFTELGRQLFHSLEPLPA